MDEMMRVSRRTLLGQAATAALGVTALPRLLAALAPKTALLVYKDPGCGCCEKWVEYMGRSGFEVSVRNTSDMDPIKRRYGVAPAIASCHTALAEGYVIEGHVPADLVLKLLKEKPKLAGLAVPGMVTGSPGMEGPNPRGYDVVAFDKTGKTTHYARR
jgi:hypothetical protein